MKKIFVLALFFFSLDGIAQDPRLFDNDWYLSQLVIDGVIYPAPYNTEVPYVPLNIDQSYLLTYLCELSAIVGNDIQVTNELINVPEFGVFTGESCQMEENISYSNLYYNGFFEFQLPNRTYLYSILEQGDNLQLTLDNINGDKAIYGNVLLANSSFYLPHVTMFPNPVKDKLTIESQALIFSTTFYDLFGRKIMSFKNRLNEISMSHLPKGLLLIVIETEKGTVIKKIIKE